MDTVNKKQILPEWYLYLEMMADEMMEYYADHSIVYAKFNEDQLININAEEELMNNVGGKNFETHSGHPLEYNWTRLTAFGSGLHVKPTISWSPYVLWDVNILYVYGKQMQYCLILQ